MLYNPSAHWKAVKQLTVETYAALAKAIMTQGTKLKLAKKASVSLWHSRFYSSHNDHLKEHYDKKSRLFICPVKRDDFTGI